MEKNRVKEERSRQAELQQAQKVEQRKQREEEKRKREMEKKNREAEIEENKKKKKDEKKRAKQEQQTIADVEKRKLGESVDKSKSSSILSQWLIKRPAHSQDPSEEKASSMLPKPCENAVPQVDLREFWEAQSAADSNGNSLGEVSDSLSMAQASSLFQSFLSTFSAPQHNTIKETFGPKERIFFRLTPPVGATKPFRENLSVHEVLNSQSQTPYNDRTCQDLPRARKVLIVNSEWEKRPPKRLIITKRPKVVSGRYPLRREAHINYDVESDEEWEERWGGEDVGNVKDDDSDKEDDDMEALGGWMVADNVIDYEEGCNVNAFESNLLPYLPPADDNSTQSPMTVGLFIPTLKYTPEDTSVIIKPHIRTDRPSFRSDFDLAVAKCFELVSEDTRRRSINKAELKEFAKVIHGRTESWTRIVHDFAKENPIIIKRSIENAYRNLIMREKRGFDSRARLYVKKEWASKLGIEDLLDSISQAATCSEMRTVAVDSQNSQKKGKRSTLCSEIQNSTAMADDSQGASCNTKKRILTEGSPAQRGFGKRKIRKTHESAKPLSETVT